MRSSPFLALALGVSLALSTGATFAQESVQPQSVSEILQFQHALRSKLDAPSGEYSRFDEGQVARMKQAQDNVFRMLSGVNSLEDLSENQKVEVSNSLDQVKAILLANESNRLICFREKKTGTNLLTKRCETYADREARARDSQQQMMDNNRRVQTEHGG
ncbi:MAG: hypothetical protein ACMG5Z_03195 [Luteimonas sp.]